MKILQLDKNHSLIREQLQSKGFQITEDYTSTYTQVLEKINDYDGIIIRSRIPLDGEFLRKAHHLKFIARVGAGMENIDTREAEKHSAHQFPRRKPRCRSRARIRDAARPNEPPLHLIRRSKKRNLAKGRK